MVGAVIVDEGKVVRPSQLIASVRQTTEDGRRRDEYDQRMRLTEPMADRVRRQPRSRVPVSEVHPSALFGSTGGNDRRLRINSNLAVKRLAIQRGVRSSAPCHITSRGVCGGRHEVGLFPSGVESETPMLRRPYWRYHPRRF